MIRDWMLLSLLAILIGSLAFKYVAEGIFELSENTRAQIYFDYEHKDF
ncbi:hypothetical protein vBRpoPV13_02 [Ruegeria phage vB_RpoP-V13]|jgi:hypothetical protein|uniref:Uncharacterized protein n=1 Tax=Ruegeria phage vB_RpoP-V13 TaxID=2218612 RepID=A0A2Z4QH96_9CAUD|nr:hypothetical protein HYP63_gp02 [Ruegeria phage vB_RpoP-V13]AWY09359.1 hypothetical protein vBRpoPV13_02 [Ruegeria phage vB_RpoP-V13]